MPKVHHNVVCLLIFVVTTKIKRKNHVQLKGKYSLLHHMQRVERIKWCRDFPVVLVKTGRVFPFLS